MTNMELIDLWRESGNPDFIDWLNKREQNESKNDKDK